MLDPCCFQGLIKLLSLRFAMLRQIYQPVALSRHLAAPLLAEREAYLRRLNAEGKSRDQQQTAADYLLHVIKRLRLKRLRKVRLSELRRAAISWQKRDAPLATGGFSSRKEFFAYARGWLRFHGKLIEPKPWYSPRDKRIELFGRYVRVELGLADSTRDDQIWILNRFFCWLNEHQTALRTVSASHVERYLDHLSALGYKVSTISTIARTLKLFFRFAERRRWTRKNISLGIFTPKRHPGSALPTGPSWSDVRRLLDSTCGSTLKQRRARAILLLTCIYALRTSEITNLCLTDLDFKENILRVVRTKNNLTQRLPMCNEVKLALKEFIKLRPNCDSPQVFVTLRTPYKRLNQGSIYHISASLMNRLGVKSVHKGAHSLRHACATHLIEVGTPVSEVASLLGHKSMKFVWYYVRYSTADLAPVADVKIRDLWI